MPETSYLQEVLKLIDPHEFDRQFWELTQDRTHEQAYKELEKRYKQVFGQNRYSSYDSYRVARDRRRKSKASAR
jgi:hypothetical protein